MELKTSQAAFVFRYFMENSFGRSSGDHRSCILNTNTTYDDGEDFVVEFSEKFPGRTPDLNHEKASSRLRSLLKELTDDGYLLRWRQSNYDQYHPRSEPNWQYAYQLKQWLINDLKRQKETPESVAIRWNGE